MPAACKSTPDGTGQHHSYAVCTAGRFETIERTTSETLFDRINSFNGAVFKQIAYVVSMSLVESYKVLLHVGYVATRWRLSSSSP